MAQVIRIKRSHATATPSSLADGELAYSHASDLLHIGNGTGVSVIGGKADHDKLAGIEAGAQVNDVDSVAGKTGAVTLVKSDITDFVEADYVHKTGNETIAGNKTFSGDVVVSGNMTVNGTTTHVNSTTVDVGDNILTLNSGETGTPTQNAGIEVERGTSDNAKLLWDESTDSWGVSVGAGAITAISLDGHQHVVADITDFAAEAEQIAVDAIAAASINDLSDVNAADAANGEVLTYNSATSKWESAPSASTVTSFTDLDDVPANFTGQAGKVVVVNAAGDGLEFSDIDGGTF